MLVSVLMQKKASNMIDKASNAAQSAKESIQEAGQQVKAKAQGASDAVKDTINEWKCLQFAYFF